jgi:hypothetical protein
LIIMIVALLASACATTTEWAAWRAHPTHFASGDHMSFSIRNSEGGPPEVTRRDLTEARAQAWWGDPVTVSQAQILTR